MVGVLVDRGSDEAVATSPAILTPAARERRRGSVTVADDPLDGVHAARTAGPEERR